MCTVHSVHSAQCTVHSAQCAQGPAWSTPAPVARNGGQERGRRQPITDHGPIFKFVAQDPRTRRGTKTDRGMIWLILGFFLQAWTCLLFFALFEYKPAWVQHEGPSLVILFYIGPSAYSIRWIRPAQQCAHKVCTKSAQVCAGRVRGIVAKVCILQNNCHSPASRFHICTFRCHSKPDRGK